MKVTRYRDEVKRFDRFVVHLNEQENGGQAVMLEAKIYDDEMEELTLEVYCYGTSSASITLGSIGIETLYEAVSKLRAEVG